MTIVSQVTELLQGVLADSMDELARATGCVRREREFSGKTLLGTLVFTVLRNPKAKPRDYQTAAAQLGVAVTETAIRQGFTPQLVKFLEAALRPVFRRVLTAAPPPVELLNRFTHVMIGDSSTITLPDAYAEQFPGCGGSHDSGKAALKLQVLWDLRHGTLHVLIEPGRASDAKSPITAIPLPAGSLSIFDLGYFSVDRFARTEQAGGYWLSRLQWGTAVYDATGQRVKLRHFLRKLARHGVVDVRVQIGDQRLPCRLVAVRTTPEHVAKRRQKIRERARERGREPSQEHLAIQEWTVFVTNGDETLLTWKEVVVLYRARWQIERLFKLWKSHNHLAERDLDAAPERQLAEIYIKLIAVIVQHGLLLLCVWLDGQRSLWCAAACLPDWIGQLLAAIPDAAALARTLDRMQQCLAKATRVNKRRKHPSCYQLLNKPELLEYTVA